MLPYVSCFPANTAAFPRASGRAQLGIYSKDPFGDLREAMKTLHVDCSPADWQRSRRAKLAERSVGGWGTSEIYRP